ncbi:MAG: aldehyde ferredoxin oxidoreductase family protein [Candidatus Thermoplasmatota archaeon]|nr:aldehyde ferredoxin oxidoreductase family protein [Candidatus Thermoplasmatota archaeon]
MAADGYTGKVLRVDLTNEKISTEPLNKEWAKQYVGGKGLGAKYLFEELKPGTDPLSPDNILSVWTGPLVGTLVPLTSRYVIVTKSPLTGTFLDSYAGGFFGPEIKYSGFDGLIITGKAPKPVYLWLDDGKAEIRDAKNIWGKDTYATEEIVRKETGQKMARVASIGPAGEHVGLISSVTNDLTRNAGRGGTGAVFGSKNLKAIAAKGSLGVEVPDMDGLLKMAKEMIRTDVVDNPDHAGMITDGTPILVEMSNDAGILPTRNWNDGTFDGHEGINSEAIKSRVFVRKRACFDCALACGTWAKVRRGIFKDSASEGPEYETLGLCGSNCGIKDVEAVVKFVEECDREGLDSISTGNAVAMAMELYEKGVLSKDDFGGLDMRFGNAEAYVKMPAMIARRQNIGALLADGTKRAAQKIGKGAEEMVVAVKGMEYPAYDPRGSIGMALAYATSDRGACHLRAWPVANDAYGSQDPWNPEGKAATCVEDQTRTSIKWSFIFCDFYGVSFPNMAKYYSAVTGNPSSEEHLRSLGRRIWNLTRAFNVREGFARKDDTLPEKMAKSPLRSGKTQGKSVSKESFEMMLSEYYSLWGWDSDGKPTKETLETVGLGDIVPRLSYLR